MRFAYRIITTIAVIALATTPAAAQVSVETYVYDATYNVTLPGTPSGPTIDFTGGLTVTTLSFTPGSVTFSGQPVDFSGTEASWIANTYTGGSSIPNSPGSSVNTTGAASTAGGAGNMNGTTEKTSLDLGPAFGNNNFDLQLSIAYDGRDHISSWSSPVVPELNGVEVEVHTQNTVTGVNPGAGVVQVSGDGEIFGILPIPTLSEWGLIILTIGLIGLAAVYMVRRRSMVIPAA